MTGDSPACRWSGDADGRVLNGRHVEKCTNEHCRGCQPCTDRHCVVCKTTHAYDQTCPSCLGRVRDDLDALADCLVRLRDQALSGSKLSGSGAVKPEAASEIPGGEAIVELGPWSNGEAATDRDQRAEESARPEATISQLLASWATDWTHAAAGTPRHPFNDDHVTWAAAHHPAFADFAREIAHHRTRIEDLVHAGTRTTRGAPCGACGRLLERQWGDREATDHWWCPVCQTSIGVVDYIETVGKNYREHAEWLTGLDLVDLYRIPAGTLRGWASTGHVRKKRDINTGRMVYNVNDATTRRDKTA